MKNRNTGYIKQGNVIDVQIKEEYFASANIISLKSDNERTNFKCNLSIHDTKTGITVELDRNFTLSSTYKTVNKDVSARLNEMIENGYFDEDVDNVKNMIECLNALLELQKKINEEKEIKQL